MSRTGRPATLRPAILLALASCPNPIGMTCSEIADAVNWNQERVRETLFRLKQDGRLFQIGEHKDSRFFSSPERREAARQLYAEHMERLYAQRKQKARELMTEANKRYRAKRRAVGKLELKQLKPSKARDALMAAIMGCTDPLGLSIDDLRALDLFRGKSLFKATEVLARREMIFVHGYRNWRRHFATKAARDAAIPVLQQMQAENSARLRREQIERKNEAKSPAVASLPKTAKPQKGVTPKAKKPQKVFTRPVPVSVKAVLPANFKDLPAIIPENVKVTRCPGFVPRTFAPPPFFKGELTREWQELRSSNQREAA